MTYIVTGIYREWWVKSAAAISEKLSFDNVIKYVVP